MTNHTDECLAPGVITKIEQQQRSRQRYNLYIDEKFAFSVHEDVLVKHRLLKGEVVDASQLQKILYEEEVNKAYLDAIRLLSSRLRSEHEMLTRLKQKGYSPEVSQVTIERLRKEGYLNDTLFAEQLTKQRLKSQKKGSRWIKQELQHKGINKEQISEAMEQVDEETEYQMAYSLTIKRYGAELEKDASKARRKIVGFLQRRGYPGSVVSKVLSRLPVQGQEDEWNETDFNED
ncbi:MULTISPECIES: RecX family transcriptional regulator [unclassified Paenibacillus]|uniref:RecX family transcriptional regulator n=1 Tax=unclassified Paenibacillus TaxID=185978 RepID=UPI001AE5281F|nr:MULTISPECIES: RecX family transcriptional regulator [unclassified Paenibacillus]MBP1155931.1 regulatory protein [Paenibacillus sp. PvP091]MBP1168683.1 regulatory protein [Paenibacillus sp. PvR098]MBP2439711.1 regulatory protein [Paenibacillus sp. PvP052]